MKKLIYLTLCTGMILLPASVFAASAVSGKLIVFHAGSLAGPFVEMEKQFKVKYPGVDFSWESGGSTKMARLISADGKTADIMASADFAVIDKYLIPKHAAWNIRFATNQLVLCYTEKSRYATEISPDNWFDILARQDVAWGHSDPNLDPCGYRSLMVLQLAEKMLKKPGLYGSLINNRPLEHVRPKASELVAWLKDGKLDYAWEYLSVAVQHQLKYLTLDERINLGNYRHDVFYQQAEVKVSGKEAGSWTTQIGQSITYGVTMIQNAPNQSAAIAFLDFLLDPDGGLKILREMGQPPFNPPWVSNAETKALLPDILQHRVTVNP